MTTQRLNTRTLAQFAPAIRAELSRHLRAGSLRVGDTLQQVFLSLFGTHRSWEERTLYLLFAAPLARRIAIELADGADRVGTTDVSVADLKIWLWWLDRMDPLCARMIDLHYFAGLSFKETAAALGLPLAAVIRDLRFAKAWLKVRLS
jgi:DNA-directed RNA polymerase specialized sigma24 family protein